MRIEIDLQGRPVFPLKLSDGELLVSALADFTNFHNNKGLIVLDVIEWTLTRKCFVYIVWMYMSLKFKHFAEPDLMEYLRAKLNYYYRKLYT
jgi:hypothetical protein